MATGASSPAGEQDQALALDLGRVGQAVDAGLDEGAEVLALEQALDQPLVAALGQGRGARRQAGGEAVRDPEPVLRTRALARAAGTAEHGRHEEWRLGGHVAGEGQGHGRGI
jgi:hypothetical protein